MRNRRRHVPLALFVLALSTSASVATVAGAEPRKVAILVWDGVELLDFAGPGEVFEAASEFAVDAPAFDVFTVGPSTASIVSQGFLEVVPNHAFADSPPPDVLIVPGGRTGALRADPELLAWIRTTAAQADVVMSVCTGASVLAEAGLLDGREATTWYGAIERFTDSYPAVRVRPGTRFVDSGPVVTTAGVSAGIDGALHVVARLHGRGVAERTAQYMEYAWTPDSRYAPSYSALDPSTDGAGRSVELARLLVAAGDTDGAVAQLRGASSASPRRGQRWLELAGLLHAAGALDEALDAYGEVDQPAALRARALYNQACIRAGRGEIEASLDTLEAAVDAGFRDGTWMSDDPDLRPLHGQARFTELLESLR